MSGQQPAIDISDTTSAILSVGAQKAVTSGSTELTTLEGLGNSSYVDNPTADPLVAVQLVNYEFGLGIGHAAIEYVRIEDSSVLETLHGFPEGGPITGFGGAVVGDNVVLKWENRVYGSRRYIWEPEDEMDRQTITFIKQSEVRDYNKMSLRALENTFSNDTQYEAPIIDSFSPQNSNSVAQVATMAIKTLAFSEGKSFNNVNVFGLNGINPGHDGFVGGLDKVGATQKPNSVGRSDP